jgi:glucose-1-phosphate thymidylyltransferase
MRIIIPMAGIGKRMRPHTLTVPKPLIKIAGKPIVQRLVEDIADSLHKISVNGNDRIDEIAFVIGDFGKEVEKNLLSIAKEIGTKGKIYYQQEALGTSHAIYCAKESIKGEVIIAFADTLFKVKNQKAIVKKQNTKSRTISDGIIWVHKVKDPSLFGVVLTDKNNIITDFFEKPGNFISNLAIIGIYYIKDGENFRDEIKNQLDNKMMMGGEFQLTDVLQNMMKKKKKFSTEEVEEWFDCGNKNSTVYTNQRILELEAGSGKLEARMSNIQYLTSNSLIIPPCYLGDDVEITNSIIGPYVSIGSKSKIDRAVISNSIIQSNSIISCVTIENSMIGNYVDFKGELNEVSIGDYTILD